MLGVVHRLAGEQGGAALLELRRAGQGDELLDRRIGRLVLGIIEQKIVEPDAEALEAAGIDGEQIGGALADHFGAMRLERGESGANVVTIHGSTHHR